MKHIIPNHTWTTIPGADIQVFQSSGANSWIDLGDDGRIEFGPSTEWKARHNSGQPVSFEPGSTVAVATF